MFYPKQVCQLPYSKDPPYLLSLFLAATHEIADRSFTIQQIKSTTVFPEIVTVQGKHILHWDMQYWEFFDRFLLELSYLLIDSAYEERFSNRVLALFYDYLSLKLLPFPELAYCIQVNRERKFGISEKDPMMNLGTLHSLGSTYESSNYYSRFLVFYHEFFHFYYKLNPSKKIEDCERLSRLAKFYCEDDWLADAEDKIIADLLMEGFQTLLYSGPNKLIEEASCDYRALIETISMQRLLANNVGKTFIEELQKIHDAFHINQVFLCYLTNICACWEALYKSYLSVDSFEELYRISQPYFDKAAQMAIIRNSIIPDFLDKLNIEKYGMLSYVNVLDKPYIKAAIRNVTDEMVDLNFMFYAIEEAIRLSQLPHYNPFELKNIVLSNAGYLTEGS